MYTGIHKTKWKTTQITQKDSFDYYGLNSAFSMNMSSICLSQVQGRILDRTPRSHGIGARLLLPAMSKASAPEHLPGLALLRQIMVKVKDKIHAKDPALHCSLSMQVAHLNKGRIWSGRKQKLNDGTVASLDFGPPLSAQTQASEGDTATSASLEQPHWWQRCMDWKANTGASWSAKVLQTKPCKMQG